MEYDLIPCLSNENELIRFSKLSQKKGKPISVHIKIDTGMGRMGCWWEYANELIKKVLNSQHIDLQGVLTHFPNPADRDFTNKQREKFLSVIQPALLKCPNLLNHADNSSSLQSCI